MTEQPRLGRKLEHDPRSRAFQARTAATTGSVLHRLYGGTLDQGQTSGCTGFSSATCLNVAPLRRMPLRTNADGLDFYTWATQNDQWPGEYPNVDDGSSGLGAAKGLKVHGVIRSYQHAFGVVHLLGTLGLQAVIVGTNWYDSMFRPNGAGFLTVSGQVVGGHEYTVRGWNATDRYFICQNQWGRWGLRGSGRFHLTYDDMSRLLSEQGDVTAFSI